MIRIISLLLVLFLFFACKKEENKENLTQENTPEVSKSESTEVKDSTNTTNLAEFSIDQDSFDFGTVKQGDVVTHEFVFTNTGKAPLIITESVGSCGCTVADYPKNPVKVGETAKIKTVFDTANKMGYQTKTVTLYMNTEKKFKILKLIGTVN